MAIVMIWIDWQALAAFASNPGNRIGQRVTGQGLANGIPQRYPVPTIHSTLLLY